MLGDGETFVWFSVKTGKEVFPSPRKFLAVVSTFETFVLLFSNPPSISAVVCVPGSFVDGVRTKCVDVCITSVLGSLLVMLICSLESFWILLRFCLSGSWMLFPLSWLIVDEGSPCTETVGKRKFSNASYSVVGVVKYCILHYCTQIPILANYKPFILF